MMDNLASRALADTYNIDSDRYDDAQLHDIIGLIKRELQERMEQGGDN